MVGFGELRELERRLRNRKVLTVFVDASVADRAAWRAELNRALFRLEAASPHLSAGERTARELCIAHLRTLLEGGRGAPGWPAWVAFVTTDDVVASGPVRARVATSVFWQTGIVVRPLRAGPTYRSVATLADDGAYTRETAVTATLGSVGGVRSASVSAPMAASTSSTSRPTVAV
jgi:hypothetical protein